MNEAVHRSPKWLRSFLDFEINTGDDIKGKSPINQKQVVEDGKRMSKDKQRRIRESIRALRESISLDWDKAPYFDKINYPKRNGVTCIVYKFENGDSIDLENNILISEKSDSVKTPYIVTYTLSSISTNVFVKLFTDISGKGKRRPKKKTVKRFVVGSKTHNKTKAKRVGNSDHPKGGMYDKLLDDIDEKEAKLKGMQKTDTRYYGLENEIKYSKKMAARMKLKFKFKN